MKTLCENEQQTKALAASLIPRFCAAKTLLLSGDLGTGKSVFARALIREITNDPALEVPSPTFTLVQTYETSHGLLYHFDLYRLKDADEIFELGWEEALSDGLVIVEWPERLGPYKPRATLDIHIRAIDNDPDAREILITD